MVLEMGCFHFSCSACDFPGVWGGIDLFHPPRQLLMLLLCSVEGCPSPQEVFFLCSTEVLFPNISKWWSTTDFSCLVVLGVGHADFIDVRMFLLFSTALAPGHFLPATAPYLCFPPSDPHIG